MNPFRRLGDLPPETGFVFARLQWNAYFTGVVVGPGLMPDGTTPCVLVRLDQPIPSNREPVAWNPDVIVEVLP